MFNFILKSAFIYSILLSMVFLILALNDYNNLIYARNNGLMDDSLVHQLSFFTNGTWFLISNIILVCSAGFGYIQGAKRNKN